MERNPRNHWVSQIHGPKTIKNSRQLSKSARKKNNNRWTIRPAYIVKQFRGRTKNKLAKESFEKSHPSWIARLRNLSCTGTLHSPSLRPVKTHHDTILCHYNTSLWTRHISNSVSPLKSAGIFNTLHSTSPRSLWKPLFSTQFFSAASCSLRQTTISVTETDAWGSWTRHWSRTLAEAFGPLVMSIERPPCCCMENRIVWCNCCFSFFSDVWILPFSPLFSQ